MALMVTKLSSKIIFRTSRILKQRQRCEELASARRTPCHDRNPADFLDNDKRPPVSGDLLLRLQHARLDAARKLKGLSPPSPKATGLKSLLCLRKGIFSNRNPSFKVERSSRQEIEKWPDGGWRWHKRAYALIGFSPIIGDDECNRLWLLKVIRRKL